MKALNKFIILRAIQEKERKTKTGIILPEEDVDEQVVAMGEVLFADSDIIKPGDIILFSKFLPVDFKYNDEVVWAIKGQDIIAVL